MGFSQRIARPCEYDRYRGLTRPAQSSTPSEYRPMELRRASCTADMVRVPETARAPTERRHGFEAGHPRHVPETWPTLLSRDQLCAYLGVSADTITRICPVRPLDLGANLVRYSRGQIDEWVATLPPRLMGAHRLRSTTAATESGADDIAETRAEAALDRVRARADGLRLRKSA